MYINNEDFEIWMQKLSKKLSEIGQDLKSLINTKEVFDPKNEVLEREIPQLQEIAGKVWKKEEELKQLKSELAALDRKIQLELAPPTPEITEKEHEGQQVKPEAKGVRNGIRQYPEDTSPQIRNPSESIIANHTITGHPGLYAKEETRSKGLKI